MANPAWNAGDVVKITLELVSSIDGTAVPAVAPVSLTIIGGPNGRVSRDMTINADGSVSYTTTSEDTPDPGQYIIQAVNGAAGNASYPIAITVGTRY